MKSDKKIMKGPRGGEYYISDSGKKVYIKTASIKKSDYRGKITTSAKIVNLNGKAIVKRPLLTKEVVDPEHEGDIDYELSCLRNIGDIDVVRIDREYTEDGEELTYACINFYCNQVDYDKFSKYCEGELDLDY